MKYQEGSHRKKVTKYGQCHVERNWVMLGFVSIAQTKVCIFMKIGDFWGHSLRGSVD